jgi:mannose-6-phosphate isomerase-like protein (cupin superfamily)
MTDAPLSARFVDLPTELPDAPCHELLVAVVSGEVTVLGDKLTAGDVLITFHPERTPLTGSGVVVIADSREPAERCGVKARPAPTRAVVRGKSVAPLVWAGGSMQANLDVPVSLSPDVYLGRLAGTAPVAEHAHEGSWEILCAVEAAGTFTLDGVDRRLEKRQIVVIPAGAKHSWKPDPGSRLEGVQLYIPPGPEQRFQALAAAAESRPIPGPRDGRRY